MKFNIDNKQVPPPNGIHWIVTDSQNHYKVSIGMPFIIDGKRYLVNEYNNGVIHLTYMPLPIEELCNCGSPTHPDYDGYCSDCG